MKKPQLPPPSRGRSALAKHPSAGSVFMMDGRPGVSSRARLAAAELQGWARERYSKGIGGRRWQNETAMDRVTTMERIRALYARKVGAADPNCLNCGRHIAPADSTCPICGTNHNT